MEADFRDRHELALRSIGALRTELDGLKAAFREKSLELDDYENDSSTLKTQIDQRLIDVEKLSNELRSLGTDAAELEVERQRLQSTAAEVRSHNEKYMIKIRNLQMEMDRVLRTTEEQ